MTDQSKLAPEIDIESRFLLGGGRIAKGLERARLARGERLRVGRTAVLAAAITWLPLLILAAAEGVAWGDGVKVPLLKDFLPYGQFLLAVPILVLGESFVGSSLGQAAAELRRSDILAPKDTPSFDALLKTAVARWRGWSVNLVFIGLIAVATVASLRGAPKWLTGGWQVAGDRLTLPGWWYLLISFSLLRFLALRWLWRLLLWAWVLWRASRLDLRPRPTHPDRAGGLAFLGATQAAFSLLVFAVGVQLSCLIADAVCYRSANLMAFRSQLVVFALIAVVFLMLPLLVFAPQLARARKAGLVFLSGSGYSGAEHLERQLRSSRSGELPANDVSGLSDFGVLYENARQMSPVPMELRDIATILIAAVLPFVPLVFLVMPAQDVFRAVRNLIL
jgi:hypothetical protein